MLSPSFTCLLPGAENGVTSIGSCAFWKCGVLSAEISSSVTTIGNHAFRESSIIAASIPSNVKTIGDSAFRGCKNLSEVLPLPEMVSLPAFVKFQASPPSSAPSAINVKILARSPFLKAWKLSGKMHLVLAQALPR